MKETVEFYRTTQSLTASLQTPAITKKLLQTTAAAFTLIRNVCDKNCDRKLFSIHFSLACVKATQENISREAKASSFDGQTCF